MSEPGQVTDALEPWPRGAFDAPALRGLDARGRTEIEAAGRLVALGAGESLYRAGDVADAFYVVLSGAVALEAVRRGDEHGSTLRVARRHDSVGEEATIGAACRSATATAVEPSLVAAVPAALYARFAERGGTSGSAEREQRALRRAATRDLLQTLALGRDLGDDDLDLLLDAVRLQAVARGQRIYDVGDVPTGCFVVAEGLVQLQTEDGDRALVRAYLARGDLFGEDELLEGRPRTTSAVALGDGQLVTVPAPAFRSLIDRNPGLAGRVRRVASDRAALQAEVVAGAAAHATQHVFRDLYRMQMARSLLAIDQARCVRCGHCAWACEDLYGVSRLVRRGDKVVTELAVASRADAGPTSLLLPNSCQHCKNPLCMIDCPTGAIGRDPVGEVFIREELCTGCGACAKACPWENVRMAPRATQLATLSVDVAVKCDLCREYEAPACVQACPTEAIVRLDPTRDFAEVRRVLGGGEPGAPPAAGDRPDRSGLWVALAVVLGSALGATGVAHQLRGLWRPASGVGWAAGVLAALLLVGLCSYVVPKRLAKRRLRRRAAVSAARRAAGDTSDRSAMARSRVRPALALHVALGALAVGAVLAHAGARFGASSGGALHLAFWLTAVTGALAAALYRVVPPWLTRLESRGSLPEDLRAERASLEHRLLREASGKSELVKTVAARVLAPYARAPLGWLVLAVSGRGLRAEQAALRARVDGVLGGRGAGKLDGLDDLIRTVVELRALPARRVYTAALRGFVPVHVICTGLVVALLLLHVLGVLVRP